MKYFKYSVTENGVSQVKCYKPEDLKDSVGHIIHMYIPSDPDNMDYARMMEGVNADPPTNTIEEVDDTE
mgnify:CR=1 FL=1